MLQDFIHSTFTKNPFAVFAPQPIGVTFENQERGEKIILMLRAHIATLTSAFFIVGLLALLPLLLPAIFGVLNIDPGNFLGGVQMFWILVFWYLFTFGVGFYRFVFWYFNVYLVTKIQNI